MKKEGLGIWGKAKAQPKHSPQRYKDTERSKLQAPSFKLQEKDLQLIKLIKLKKQSKPPRAAALAAACNEV